MITAEGIAGQLAVIFVDAPPDELLRIARTALHHVDSALAAARVMTGSVELASTIASYIFARAMLSSMHERGVAMRAVLDDIHETWDRAVRAEMAARADRAAGSGPS